MSESEKKAHLAEAKSNFRKAENNLRNVVFDIAKTHGRDAARILVRQKLVEYTLNDPTFEEDFTVESVRLYSSILSDLSDLNNVPE